MSASYVFPSIRSIYLWMSYYGERVATNIDGVVYVLAMDDTGEIKDQFGNAWGICGLDPKDFYKVVGNN